MSDIRDRLKAAILGQESGNGAADTSQPNYAGAIGPGQIIPATFDGLKNKGLIPKDFDINNPAHNRAASGALLDSLMDKYADDPAKAAAAYYAGEKAVRPDGSIANYRDRKNPNAPTVFQYQDQVLHRMGPEYDNGTFAGSPVLPSFQTAPPTIDDWSNTPGNGPKSPRSILTPKETNDILPKADPLTGPDVNSANLVANTKELQDETAHYDAHGIIPTAIDLAAHQGLTGVIIRAIADEGHGKPQPGYVPSVVDKELYAGRTEADHQYLDEATNHQDALRRDLTIQRREDDMKEAATQGTATTIMASLVGGLPEGFGIGGVAARTMTLARTARAVMGARTAAEAAPGLLSHFTEQALGNVGSVAAQQAFDPYVSKDDYMMAAFNTLLFTGIGGIGHAFSKEDAVTARAIGQAGADDAGYKINKVRQQALDNLGPDATPEALRAEAARLEGNEVRGTIQAATSAVGEDRRLIPDVENIAADITTKRAEAEAKAPAPGDGEKAPAKVEDDGEVVPVSNLPTVDNHEAVAMHLGDTAAQSTRVGFRSENPTFYHDVGSARVRENLARNDPKWRANIAELGEGTTMEHIDTLPKGVHVMPGAAADPVISKVGAALKDLASHYLDKSKIIVGKIKDDPSGIIAQQAQKAGSKSVPNGAVVSAGNAHIIGIKSRNLEGAMLTGIHELGHAIFHENLANIPPKLLARMAAAHQSFIKDLAAGNASARFKRLSADVDNHIGKDGKLLGKLPDNAYAASFDEYTAEAYVRYIQDKVNSGTGPKLNAEAKSALTKVWERIKSLWDYARGKGYLGDDVPYHEFFDHVMNGSLKDADKVPVGETQYLDPGLTLDFNTHFDPVAQKIGSDLMPQKTVQQEAEAQAVVGIHKQAAAYAAKNPVNVQRLSKLLKNTVFDPISSVMLRSANPVVRMISAELIENGAGAAGRRSTAALGKWIHEQAFMGNVINDTQKQYVEWRNLQGGGWVGDFMDGKLRATFDKMVAQEIEGRKPGATKVQAPEQVIKAADHFEAAYERMRVQQVASKTTGWASLPETSAGYMPHRMSRDAVLNLTVGPDGIAKTNALHSALTDQFMSIEGFDHSFSAQLTSKYIDRVKRSALGGYEAPGGIHQVGAADIVEEALQAMGLDREQVRSMMGRYMAGGPGHTKRRLQLDLTAEHDNGVGGTFTLMDLFETNQLKLLRAQAGRVSGEVALAQHGVMGKAGLALLRRAMEFGDHGPASAKEFEAFDQMAAEFLGAPFGTAAGKYADRAMQLNSLARLGGMGFQQAAEYINGIVHVGAARTASAVAGMPRLRAEAAKLARGEKVDNPILSSLEVNGAEFGTHPYKMVFPFDEESHGSAQVYGQDTPTFLDRALRGASHVQAKLSFWRAIHGAQHRGFAEQIVHKTMKFVRNGGDDIALNDMGIGKDLRDKLAKELPNIAEFNADGSLQRFDITKMKDTQAAAEYIQAVHRGTNQIIQGTLIGETGKWAHSGFLRLLTQFRSFGIASIEKQWGRQVGNHGTAAALGMVLGSMSVAAPIYMAKVALNAQGRKDKQAYLDRMLTASAIASATLNLVSTTGLASDFLDATKAVTGLGTGSGGRAGQGSDLVGGVIAPAAGLANDLYKGIQNTKKGTDPHDLIKALPFSNLPGMVPAIEGLFGK